MSRYFLCSFFLSIIFLTFLLSQLITDRSQVSDLTFHTCNTDAFRKQELYPSQYNRLIKQTSDLCQKFKPQEYRFLRKCYSAIWSDPVFFPVASNQIFFRDTWHKNSVCCKNTCHEGTDLWGTGPYTDYFPVISVSAGTIIQSGWNTTTGYQLLIQGPSGGFFYYSLLSSFDKKWTTGETVSAGDILGYMGSYESIFPGTTSGKHISFLHFGIYINDIDGQKISVNPYRVLRSIYKKIRNYAY